MAAPNDACPAPYKTSYGSEWSDPSVSACRADVSISFDGKNLYIWRKNKKYVSFPAVSGKPVKTPGGKTGFDYSTDRQGMPGIGPIPAGDYWINPSEMWENAWYKPASDAAWGTHRITIHPYKRTDTSCRGGFFIHGGDTPGSAGCIDLTSWMSFFVKELKDAVGNGPDCHVQLIAAYK